MANSPKSQQRPKRQRILVRAPNWIGDQVLAYPFFHYLRKKFPDAEITSACVPWVAEIQFKNLVDRVHVISKAARSDLWSKWKWLEEESEALKKVGPWDRAYCLPNSFSSAWMIYRAGAVDRVGYRAEGRGFLLNEGMDWSPDPQRHRAQAYLDLLGSDPLREGARRFWGLPSENELDPGTTGVLESFPDRDAWPGIERLVPPSEPYWVLAPGATAESRRWPTEYFVQLSKLIFAATGMKGLVVGGPREAPIADDLCADRSTGLSNWTARGPIPSLVDVFRKSRFSVTNESGLAHVAALCGTLVQIVCGAADPRRTTPIGPGRVQVAFNPVDCWPCESNTCANPPDKKLICLKGIRPETVWEEIQRGDRLQRRAIYS